MAGATVELIQEGKDITIPLTETETDRLRQCEQVIKNGLSNFLAVGQALTEIRDNRLYRVTHKAFERYCKDVWDLGKARAYQKVDGYRVVSLLEEKMSTMVDISETAPNQAEVTTPDQKDNQHEVILPLNERQTRPLTKLSEENQIKVWELVLQQLKDGEKPTSALVKKAVREVCGEVAKKRFIDTKEKVESTQLVSKLFKSQYNVLADIIREEQINEWKHSKKESVIHHLNQLIRLAKAEV